MSERFRPKKVSAEVASVESGAATLTSGDQEFAADVAAFASGINVGDTLDVTPGPKNESGIATATPFEPNSFNGMKSYTEVCGNPSLVLLLSMTIALITWVRWKSPGGKDFASAVETALLSGGLVILITAAGGAFGAMLKTTNVAADIKELFAGSDAVGLMSLFLAFGMAALLKVAQGSSTTAMITVSGMMASFGLTASELGFNLVYLCTAIGAGSCIGSWMNDSGFWIVAKMSGLSETEALKTWTPLLATLGVVSLIVTILLTKVLPLMPA